MVLATAAVTDGTDPSRRNASAAVTPREMYDALGRQTSDVRGLIDGLRQEVSNARHEQTNRITAAIYEMQKETDARIRALETTVATANPVSLGPRLQAVEAQLAKLDGESSGPKRIADLEQTVDQQRGALKALGVVTTVLGLVATALGIYSALNA